jgi:hypothetical protein
MWAKSAHEEALMRLEKYMAVGLRRRIQKDEV